MSPDRDVPMPGTTHPAYAAHEVTIRRWLHGEMEGAPRNDLRIPKFRRPKVERYTEGASRSASSSLDFGTFDLARHTCVAPAPYVGDPYMLTWDVAVDQYGRTVAGLTTYKYVPPGLG